MILSSTTVGRASECYDALFYARVDEESRRSAEKIVPLVLGLLPVASVVDVGCGHGIWLAVFREHGIAQIHGLDGPWVLPHSLAIPIECFTACDLNGDWPLRRKFDLAMSLEVAEHLPSAFAARFVEQLVALAPAVLFSAAVPGQGGTEHRNEQWPDFWENLFFSHGYLRLDPIRRHVWMDPHVTWYYQQNIYLYVHEAALSDSPVLLRERQLADACSLTLVHKRLLSDAGSFKAALRQVRIRAASALRRRWSGLALSLRKASV